MTSVVEELVCTQCKVPKPATLGYFSAYRSRSKGLRNRKHRLVIGTCRECENKYPKARYNKNKVVILAAQKEEYAADPTRKRVQAAARRKEQPVAFKRAQRNAVLKKKFGITLADYERLYVEQNGLCAICGKPPIGRLHVDHDHVTGQVRQLLCRQCNMGLGHFEDDPLLLEKATAYLKKHRTNVIPLRREGAV